MKTIKQIRIGWVCLLALTGLSGCATKVYQLTPVSGEVAQIEGRPTTKAETDGIAVVASFERLDMQYVALDIEVKNGTDRPFDVNPADFEYTALDDEQKTLFVTNNASQKPLMFSAADPVREADRTSVNQEREVKRLKTAKIINTVLMVAAIASDVATSSNRSNQRPERWVQNRVTHDNIYAAIQAKRIIDHGMFADRMQRYDYETYRWKELSMKPTTLQPGESVRGLVYLPMSRDARHMLVNFPVTAQESVMITFQQEWVKQKHKRRK
ncbi:hypothetical protein LX87_02092 [Larkinella arboricola]|uniref:Uncharacterized protein n=1 Tax=Larkinella arboricola TaxID=643671 RepID=A0A327X2M6_LARAB|nr:hypothetical protein [Larkinella arboricola]RAK00390.1 hypothetical protein LX87_02092 [Larkinella arboricola]